MANPTQVPASASNLPPANLPVSPTNVRKSPSAAAPGVGNGTSTLAASSTSSGIPPLAQGGSAAGPLSSHQPPLVSGTTQPTVLESPRKEPKSTTNDGELTANNYDALLSMRISRTAQRIMVRLPHAFIAIAMVFVPIYYGSDKENLAYDAAAFVGVAGIVYCVVRAVFLEILPEWMMPLEKTREWRHLMNATYTAFITVIFTSAIWKLEKLSAVQGLVLFTLAFGVPYRWLASYYDGHPYVDKQPTFDTAKYRPAGK